MCNHHRAIVYILDAFHKNISLYKLCKIRNVQCKQRFTCELRLTKILNDTGSKKAAGCNEWGTVGAVIKACKLKIDLLMNVMMTSKIKIYTLHIVEFTCCRSVEVRIYITTC